MAITAQFEIPIGRSVDDVFSHLLALERYPEWLVSTGVVAVHLQPGVPLVPGTRFGVQQRIAGRSTTLDGSVVALDPGRRFAFHAVDREGISIDVDAQLAPDGPTTRLRWALRLGLPLRYRLFESIAAPQVRAAATEDLERFRRMLEAVAG
jgi:hypothetical protein